MKELINVFEKVLIKGEDAIEDLGIDPNLPETVIGHAAICALRSYFESARDELDKIKQESEWLEHSLAERVEYREDRERLKRLARMINDL